MSRVIKEPLLHFFLIALLVFALYDVLHRGDGGAGGDVIVVDRGALLEYLQFRNRSFDPDRFARLLDVMPPAEKERLIADYVREEVLYREAKAMRLDSHDYVARLRLVQQLEYLTKATVERDFQLTMEDVRAFYEDNAENYYLPPKLTFTHVFVRKDDGMTDAALYEKALQIKGRLERDKVGFGASGAYGDRFLYHLNYVDKSEQELASHFGDAMAKQLIDMPASPAHWQGPLLSPYGYHLVLLVRQTDAVMPAFEQVLAKVERDAYEILLNRRVQQALEERVSRYRVEVVDAPEEREQQAAPMGSGEDDV